MILQSQDLTDTRVIERDFSRKRNIEDDKCRQLAVLAYVVFNIRMRMRKKGDKEEGWNPICEGTCSKRRVL